MLAEINDYELTAAQPFFDLPYERAAPVLKGLQVVLGLAQEAAGAAGRIKHFVLPTADFYFGQGLRYVKASLSHIRCTVRPVEIVTGPGGDGHKRTPLWPAQAAASGCLFSVIS
jgi:hypothetical protein